ncbi:hypothetical protein LTR74_003361 [Friedmanniomyces endolithicus]|nr:hypothetical protein LTR74_003361 [Friedmanniomyces endolithicus]
MPTSHHHRPPLRLVPASPRHFWKPTIGEQLSQEAEDDDTNGFARAVPCNELLCMALNEAAAHNRQGFFFYLPSRECWKKPPVETVLPVSRRPLPLSSQYPTLVYMDFTWGDGEYAEFIREPQRSRFLRCNALINPPPDPTPLYAVQVIAHWQSMAFVTPTPSLVLYATPSLYYLATTSELRHPDTIGAWSRAHKPRGPEPEARLNTALCLWDDATRSESSDAQQRRAAMRDMEHTSLEALYDEIVRKCTPPFPPSFEASELRQLIPRPSAPEPGTPLGSSNDLVYEPPAEPARLRGRRSKRRASSPAESDPQVAPQSAHDADMDVDEGSLDEITQTGF